MAGRSISRIQVSIKCHKYAHNNCYTETIHKTDMNFKQYAEYKEKYLKKKFAFIY